MLGSRKGERGSRQDDPSQYTVLTFKTHFFILIISMICSIHLNALSWGPDTCEDFLT